MKQFIGFILGALLTFTLVGCAAMMTAPSMVASGLTIYQAAKQLAGIASSLSVTTSSSCTQDTALAERMEGYAKWADTIAKAAAEIEAGSKRKE